jgi:hypothetical protein
MQQAIKVNAEKKKKTWKTMIEMDLLIYAPESFAC